MRPDLELEFLFKLIGEGAERRVGHFDHPPTLLTHQVLMRVVDQVVNGASVTEMNVIDYPKALEGIESAIHS